MIRRNFPPAVEWLEDETNLGEMQDQDDTLVQPIIQLFNDHQCCGNCSCGCNGTSMVFSNRIAALAFGPWEPWTP